MQASIDRAAEMVVWFRPDGSVYYVNDAACRTLGYSREELLKMNAQDFSPGFTKEQYEEHWREVRARKSFTLQPVHRRKDGSTYTAEVLVNHVVYGGQEFIFAFGRDITERKQTEEALRASESFYRQTLESIPGMVFTTRPDGYCDYQSQQWVDYTGVPMAEHLGDGWNKLQHPDDRPRSYAAWNAAVQGQAPYDLEYRVRRHDGVYEWFKVIGRPIRDGSGQIARWFGVALNIQDIKDAEEAIKASLTEKEVLLKEIHHRVKNNLQVISSLVELQTKSLDDPLLRGLFQDVRDRVRSMALVHEKLYQSESLAGVEFADYARSLIGFLTRAHRRAETTVRLKLDLQPVSLPVETAVPCGLILNELITNAFKHAFRGRSQGEITTTLRGGPDGRVSLRVSDDGVGLPAGMDWRESQSLGLRLIYLLAGQLDASVEVKTGGGTEFLISFAQRQPAQAEGQEHA